MTSSTAQTYLIRSLERRNGIRDPARQPPGSLCAIHLFQLLRQDPQIIDLARYTVPVRILSIPAALSVDPETRVVQALYKEVPPLVAVSTPRLDRQWLVLVVAVPLLLVLVFDNGRDCFGGGEGPHDEGAEEVELLYG